MRVPRVRLTVGELSAAIDRFFAPHGLLVLNSAGYTYRQGQHAMAIEVATAIEGHGTLVIEAGTGIGKTFAYLAPLLLASGRALVSTATKALQDQLLVDDLPRLQSLLKSTAKAVALKGRSSYVCLQRLACAMQDEQTRALASPSVWSALDVWSRASVVGDMAEFPGLEDDARILAAVTSTRENCLGAECPQLAGCHVNRARREAMDADLVIVNHHLFFADFLIRESGVAELLPNATTVVFDEAHQLNDIGVQFLGKQLAAAQLSAFLRDVKRITSRYAVGWSTWAAMIERCQVQSDVISEISAGLKKKAIWKSGFPAGINSDLWKESLSAFRKALDAILDAVQAAAESAVEFHPLIQRGERLRELLKIFTSAEDDTLRWLEPGPSWRLVSSPLDIAKSMQTRFFGLDAAPSRRTWIFTSATLGSDAGLSWFTRACGIDNAKVVQIPSPFDYANQAALYVPEEFPAPGETAHSARVAELVARAATVLGGKTLVLATTLRAMRVIAATLEASLAPGKFQVLVQGQAPKLALLGRFRKAGCSGALPAVLVASASFWEGVDISGDALQLLVIDKLPFAPPDDPIQQARSDRIDRAGGNAFRDLHLVQATIALRQGAGRLIRSELDRGVLVVCDRRLLSASYGKKLIACLPPMRRLHSREELLESLQKLPELPPGAVFGLASQGQKV